MVEFRIPYSFVHCFPMLRLSKLTHDFPTHKQEDAIIQKESSIPSQLWKMLASQVPFNFLLQQCFYLSKQQVLQVFKVHFLAAECQPPRNHTGVLSAASIKCQDSAHCFPTTPLMELKKSEIAPFLHKHVYILSAPIYIPCLLGARHTCTHLLSYHTFDQAVSIHINTEM